MINRDEILAYVRAEYARMESKLVAMSTDESLTEEQRRQVKRALREWRHEPTSRAKRRKRPLVVS